MALPVDLFNLQLYTAGDPDAGTGADRVPARATRPSHSPSHRPSRSVGLPADLVVRVQRRDVEALREFVRIAYGEMVRFAKTIVGSRDAAEDVVQGIFTTIWERGERWAPSGDPVAYLFATVRNHSLSELRRRDRAERRARRAYAETRLAANAGGDDTAADVLEQVVASETERLQIRTIETALASLTERQRSAYDLRYRRGLTVPAIATVLGITTKSAEQLIGRVTHRVWELVQQELAKSR